MKKILIIDDNTDIRENIAEILELAGYKSITAEDGKAGLETAIKETPDLIICDIIMPQLDGYGVLHLLKKNKAMQQIPFIFLTAKSERPDLRKGMEMGADDFITKPFEEVELLAAVETRLKKADLIKQTYGSLSSDEKMALATKSEATLLQSLLKKYEVYPVYKKQTVYKENKKPKYLYYIVSGKIKCIKIHGDGKEYVLDILGEGDCMGHIAILQDEASNHSSIVMEDAELLQIPKNDFLTLMHEDATVVSSIIRLLARNVKEKEERLLSLAYSSLRKRVAQALLDLGKKYGSANAIEISREEFAQYVGTATESLIRTLSDFKAEKLVEIKEGKVHIMQMQKLENLIS